MNTDELKRLLQWLRGEDGVAPVSEVESVLGDILDPLLREEGLQLLSRRTDQDKSIDFAAKPFDSYDGKLSVVVEYKHYGGGRALNVDAVHQLLGAIASGSFDRALLISRFGFTTEAKAAAQKAELKLELHDLSTIGAWIDRIAESQPTKRTRVQFLVRSISHEFAKLVAESPEYLNDLEWRDFERMMERVMSGLGFDTILTPASKDGGKDLILSCTVSNECETYVVELKHWRAGSAVGKGPISDFVKVILRENSAGGLFLSTSGYTFNASEAITELTKQRLRLGGKTKVVALCQTYVRAESGLWNPPEELPEILYEGLQ